MAITSKKNDGYKISQLEEIEGLKTSIDDTDGSVLDAENLFVISNTDDGGTSYSSKKLKYSDLAMSLATSIDGMLGGNGQGSKIGGAECCFEGIGIPGNDYPIANAFFPNQLTIVSAVSFPCPSVQGIYFNDNQQVTVPDINAGKLVNVNVFLSAYSTSTTSVKPGLGIYVVQKNALNGSEIKIPIKDEQADTAGWSVCITNFIAKPGTTFGGYVYNPNTQIGKISAFFRAPMPSIYEGEEDGESYKIYFGEDLSASVVNDTLTGNPGYYEVKSSLALTEAGNSYLQASINNGQTWDNLFMTKIPTNAGSGSAATKLRNHSSIYIPSGCLLRFITYKNIVKNKYVTNKDPATIYLVKKDDEGPIEANYQNGIAAIFSGAATTETFQLQLAKSGKLNINWNKQATANQKTRLFGEQLNYISTTMHDGSWETLTASPHVIYAYSSSGDHLAYIGGASSDQRILGFRASKIRNTITHLSTYSPTTLSANCLSGCTSLSSVYSNTGSIQSLKNNCLKDCTSLTSVNLTCSSSLTIDGQCFAGDTSLRQLKIDGGQITKAFGNSFARNCTSLTSVSLPRFNDKVGDQTDSNAPFYNCSSLTSLYLNATPNGYIDGAIARNCTSLKEFVFDGGCKAVNANMMFDRTTMDSLTSFTVNFYTPPYTFTGGGITGSTSLKTLSFTNVKIATASAFQNNKELTSIVFSGECWPIPTKTFSSCTKLKDVVFEDENAAQHIPKTLFGAKCFQLGPSTINMYFEDGVTKDTIEKIMKYNTGANSILYSDTDKNSTFQRMINVYRIKARGYIEDPDKEKLLRIGSYIFTHEKNNKGVSTYNENWDLNEDYEPDFDPTT